MATGSPDFQVWESVSSIRDQSLGQGPQSLPAPHSVLSLPTIAAPHRSEACQRRARPLVLTWQQSAHSTPNAPLPVGPQPLPGPKPYWVLVLPACTAYAWLVPWCLLFIRLFLLNFCFCLAHLACVVPVFLATSLHSAAALPPSLPLPSQLRALVHPEATGRSP